MRELRRHRWGHRVYLAYTDESGDSGFENSPTKHLVISCVLIYELEWQATLERLIALRQELKKKHGIPVRSELKAEHLIYGRGSLKGLNLKRHERISIYESLLDFEAGSLDIQTFAIAIAKEKIISQAINDPRKRAWEYLMQRLDNFCKKQDPPDRVILLPDEGHGPLVRTIMRKARKFQKIKGLYGGELDIPARYLIEDPLEKKSSESYFTQVADWNAYAAHRYKEVDPNKKAPADLWDRLNGVLLHDVNKETGGPPGIVLWPRT